MNALAARAGGAHIARERGAFEAPIRVLPLVLGADRRSPLIERLSVASLTVVANVLKVQLCDLAERYS